MNDLRTLPLSSLVLSQTAAQAERRAHFSDSAIAELAESIKTVGLLSPIVARPEYSVEVRQCESTERWYPHVVVPGRANTNIQGSGHDTSDAAEQEAEQLRTDMSYEIVAGERRYLAAQRAGLAEIPVSVRELNDQQVLEVQLVENLQREGLHPLTEAEGYEALMQLGRTVDEIAEQTGKSKATIYARMKLIALSPRCRAAMRKGEVSASIALLLARIPDHGMQAKALEELLDRGDEDEPISYRHAVSLIHNGFTFRLEQAGFDTNDVDLVPNAGPCSSCPKRSGSQPELFPDIHRADVCTDPVCFRAKRDAHGAKLIAAANESGQRVIEGKQAAKIAKHGVNYLQDGFVNLDQHCYQDGRSRTYREIVGKKLEPALLVDPTSGAVVEVIEQKKVEPLLPKRAPTPSPYKAADKKAQAKREHTLQLRRAIFRAVLTAAPAKLGRPELEAIALSLYHCGFGDDEQLYEALGWTAASKRMVGDEAVKHFIRELRGLGDAELSRLVYSLTVIQDVVDEFGKGEDLLAVAKHLKIDVKKIEQQLEAAAAAKAKAEKPAVAKSKASKKKAARKPK